MGDIEEVNTWQRVEFSSDTHIDVAASVGCACVHSPTNSSLHVVGGASPESGVSSAVWRYDIVARSWQQCSRLADPMCSGRYEHVAFIPHDKPGMIYMLLGADTDGPVDDGEKVLVFDTGSDEWSAVSVTGCQPSPRTHHTTCAVGNACFIFSGGLRGVTPVADANMYTFDAAEHRWHRGTGGTCQPPPRQGHIMVPVSTGGTSATYILVHGGMSGAAFFSDLWLYDTVNEEWSSYSGTKVRDSAAVSAPCARAAHGAVSDCDTSTVYIFGGMSEIGPLNDLWELRTGENDYFMFTNANNEMSLIGVLSDTFEWMEVVMRGVAIEPRLDFSLVRVKSLGSQIEEGNGPETSPQARVHVFIFGGCGASGQPIASVYQATLVPARKGY